LTLVYVPDVAAVEAVKEISICGIEQPVQGVDQVAVTFWTVGAC
jgi:hypothetical protein